MEQTEQVASRSGHCNDLVIGQGLCGLICVACTPLLLGASGQELVPGLLLLCLEL